MKKVTIWLLLIVSSLPAFSVLKEENLSKTLLVLRQELETYQEETKATIARSQMIKEQVRDWAFTTLSNSNQTALMLYSQKIDYIFDLTYACHQATTQYDEFAGKRMPFDKIRLKMEIEKERYEGLIESLKIMPKMILSEQEQKDRDVCLTLATYMRRQLIQQDGDIVEYTNMYNLIEKRLKTLHDYAESRYTNIRQSIFVNGDDSYFQILSKLPRYIKKAQTSSDEKYKKSNKRKGTQWGGRVIMMLFFFVSFYAVVSILLNVLCIRFLMPKKRRTSEFLKKRTCIILASTVITFAIVVMVLWLFVLKHNFFIMACSLLVQYAWLLGVILVSLLIRLSGDQIKSGFRIYMPIILVGFIVIVFRIVLIPNEVVNLIFPALMVLCTIWQLSVIIRHNDNIPKSDIFYTWISLAVMTAGVVVSWSGYTLMAVQLLIWWIMQLTCIQTITCIYDLLGGYENKHKISETNISKSWLFDLIRHAIVPMLACASVMFSIYWATLVFELTDWCNYIFFSNFINISGVASVSIMKLFIVICLWFLVKYIVYVGRSMFMLYYGGKEKEVVGEKALYLKIGVIVIWLAYIVISMLVLNISNSGILVAMGGLSTGIGFAMKDTIENLFYGASLMTGRLHIGDIIECDGVRGKVSDINYQSTMVEALDGSVIAFLNSQLFTKNFKNLTRNHDYEIVKVPVGVAYGTNVAETRDLLKNAVDKLDCYDKEKGVNVAFEEFGDNSVNLSVVIWIPVATKLTSLSKINETIYNVLNENKIEIPFPQQDIYIRKIIEPETKKD